MELHHEKILSPVQNLIQRAYGIGRVIVAAQTSQRLAEGLIEMQEQQVLHEALALRRLGGVVGNHDVIVHQTKVIAHILAKSIVRRASMGEPLDNNDVVQLKHFIDELPPSESVETLELPLADVKQIKDYLEE